MRLFVLLLLLLPALARADTPSRVDMEGGRYYLIALPEGVPNPPLILALHGGGGSPEQFALLTVENGAHVWPGGRRARGEGATQDISATDEVIRFLAVWR